LSADHLEYLDGAGVAAMAQSGTVAVLLPLPFYYLRETRRPPVQALRDRGVAIAVASDINPGSAPMGSLLLALNMAAVLFGLTPEEALLGATVNAARALALHADRGQIAAGMRADLAVWPVEHPRELVASFGVVRPAAVYIDGA
jgi:imidazolonepropionase